jgi:hypothetical protein
MISGTRTAAIMPGRMVRKGTNILGKAPMTGVLRAEEMESEAIARCTSTKLVVQYPKESTKPSPKTMPTTDQNGESKPVSACPAQELSCWSGGGTSADAGAVCAISVTFSCSPCHPPTLLSPMRERGSRLATMTKNWSTSL